MLRADWRKLNLYLSLLTSKKEKTIYGVKFSFVISAAMAARKLSHEYGIALHILRLLEEIIGEAYESLPHKTILCKKETMKMLVKYTEKTGSMC